MGGSSPRPPRAGAPLEQDHRFAGGQGAKALEEGPAVRKPLEVGQADGGGGVVRVVGEVVGHRRRRRVAGRHGPAHADARLDGEVHERRDEVARLADNGYTSRRRVGGDDLGAERGRSRDEALAVGAGEKHAQLLGRSDELGLCPLAVDAGFPVTGGGDEGSLDPFARARPEQLHVGRRGRADHDEVGRSGGELVGGPDRLQAEHLLPAEGDGEHPSGKVVAQDVVQGDEAELARVTGGTGHGHTPGLEQGAEPFSPVGIQGRRRDGA